MSSGYLQNWPRRKSMFFGPDRWDQRTAGTIAAVVDVNAEGGWAWGDRAAGNDFAVGEALDSAQFWMPANYQSTISLTAYFAHLHNVGDAAINIGVRYAMATRAMNVGADAFTVAFAAATNLPNLVLRDGAGAWAFADDIIFTTAMTVPPTWRASSMVKMEFSRVATTSANNPVNSPYFLGVEIGYNEAGANEI